MTSAEAGVIVDLHWRIAVSAGPRSLTLEHILERAGEVGASRSPGGLSR